METVSQSCYHINRPSRGRGSVIRFSGRIGRVTNVVVQSYIFWCRFFRAVYDGLNGAILPVVFTAASIGRFAFIYTQISQ